MSSKQKRLSWLGAALSILFGPIVVATRVLPIRSCGWYICGWGGIGCLAMIAALILVTLSVYNAVLSRVHIAIAILAVVVNAGSVLFLFYGPQEADFRARRFESHFGEYNEAAVFVEGEGVAEEYPSLCCYQTYLPSEYRDLSTCGGRILLQQDEMTRVFFYDWYDGWSFAGFLYASDDTLPDAEEHFFMLAVPERDCRRIRPNWFYCEYWD